MNYLGSLLGVMMMAVAIHGATLPKNVDALKAVTSGASDFATKFNEALAKEKSGNYVSSSLSVDVVLAMTNVGAEGNTKVQLQQALRSPTDEAIMKNGYQALIDMLNNAEGAELAIANKVYVANDFDVKDEFKETTKTYYRSEPESLDFSNNQEAAQKINNWVETQTKGHIKELYKSEDFSSATVMVLANAVYFKGQWAHPFNANFTAPKTFHVDDTTSKNVDMMFRSGNYNWGEVENFNAKYIELPYAKEDFSMFVFVPNEMSGLAHLEENAHNIDLAKLDKPKSKLQLSIPKFKIESKFDLKSVLNKLNITDMFDYNANFRGINEEAQLRVGKIVQKAVIEVNEQGSVAAGSTGVEVETTSLPPQLTIDKPFICLLVAKKIGVTIFNARVVDPTVAI